MKVDGVRIVEGVELVARVPRSVERVVASVSGLRPASESQPTIPETRIRARAERPSKRRIEHSFRRGRCVAGGFHHGCFGPITLKDVMNFVTSGVSTVRKGPSTLR